MMMLATEGEGALGILFSTIAYAFMRFLNGAANLLLRLFKIAPARGRERGHAPQATDAALRAGVFDFHDKKARDVMRPRTDVVALPLEATEGEVWELVRAERYSRYPVYQGNLDDVVGVFLAKDLWLHEKTKAFALSEYVRPAMYVPDNRLAERVLEDLRKHRAQMAVVLDEFGGTAGIVTLEDLIEEVMGDINDEYDFALRQSVEVNGVLELAGSMLLVDVRSDYELAIPDGEWNTLGGYVFGTLGRLVKMGDRVRFPGGELEVVAMDARRVAAVRVLLTADAARQASVQKPAAGRAAAQAKFTDREVPL